jgi:uncharacterized protein
MTGTSMTIEFATLTDWRRHIAEMYADVRARLSTDPIGAHRRWRERRDQLFRDHPQSPLRGDTRRHFTGLRYFDYDARFAFVAAVRPLADERLEIAASDGGTMSIIRCGAVDLPIGTLEIMWFDTYAGGLFLPFRDTTSGTTTYGGGRYLLDTAKNADLGAKDGALVLDFNFAYHPSCAYDSGWSCPLAPPSNRLDVAVEAGERATGGHVL